MSLLIVSIHVNQLSRTKCFKPEKWKNCFFKKMMKNEKCLLINSLINFRSNVKTVVWRSVTFCDPLLSDAVGCIASILSEFSWGSCIEVRLDFRVRPDMRYASEAARELHEASWSIMKLPEPSTTMFCWALLAWGVWKTVANREYLSASKFINNNKMQEKTLLLSITRKLERPFNKLHKSRHWTRPPPRFSVSSPSSIWKVATSWRKQLNKRFHNCSTTVPQKAKNGEDGEVLLA